MEPGRAKFTDFAACDHPGGPTASTSWRSAASTRCSATCASCARRTPPPYEYWGPFPLAPPPSRSHFGAQTLSIPAAAAAARPHPFGARALSPRPLAAAAARPHPFGARPVQPPRSSRPASPPIRHAPHASAVFRARALCWAVWSRTAAQTATWALANFYRFGASEADVRRGLPVFARLLFSSDAAVVRLLVAPYASHACFAHARTRVHGSHRLLKRACICTRARAHAAAHASPCAPCPLAPLTLT